MSEGVEWAVHCCLGIAWAPDDRALPAARLAAYYSLPAPYLNKQLQALTRAGILASTPGPRGGFRLARPLHAITLMDVVCAIEGTDPAFRCTEIRLNTPEGRATVDPGVPCAVDRAMNRAELAWRRELAGQTLADIHASVHPDVIAGARTHFTD
ncbi:RrF2 family transcriptional regulator [Saccharothrix violaceirubra]|nr:Rrf2 family transcriptional regulator [Saccharothrix violaceirubra]